jgi:hypothetical protein
MLREFKKLHRGHREGTEFQEAQTTLAVFSVSKLNTLFVCGPIVLNLLCFTFVIFVSFCSKINFQNFSLLCDSASDMVF